MKKALIICLLFLATLYNLNSYAKKNEQPLDSIVAIVNDDVITHSELSRAMSLAKMQMSQANAATPSADLLHKQVLDQLINRKLQLQIAKQIGLNVTDEELDQAILRVANMNSMTLDAFYQRLTQEGMSKEIYRHEIHDQMVLQKLQQQEVMSKINITPQEIKSFRHTEPMQANAEKEYHIEDILIPLSDTPSPKEMTAAKEEAESTLAKLKSGQTFKAIASAQPTLQNTDLGWRKLPELPTAFTEEVAHMKTKDIAGPIQTANGFHLIRLTESRATGTDKNTVDPKQIQEALLQRKFEEAVQNWISKLRSEAFINTHPQQS